VDIVSETKFDELITGSIFVLPNPFLSFFISHICNHPIKCSYWTTDWYNDVTRLRLMGGTLL